MMIAPGLIAQTARPQPHSRERASPQSITCFAHPHETTAEHRAALSTVMLVPLDDSGELGPDRFIGSGSGVIVTNSAVNPEAGNRILTDAHVLGIKTEDVDPSFDLGVQGGQAPIVAKAAKRILVVSSSTGTVLGEATPIVLGTTDVSDNLRDDQAVLEMTKFYQEKQYRNIPGLELAKYQSPSGVLDAQLIGKAGVDGGASGGPAMDSSGKIAGLIEESEPQPEVTVSDPQLLSLETKRHYEKQGNGTLLTEYPTYNFSGDPVTPHKVTLSGNNIPFIESVINPEILAALGKAGEGITVKSMPNQRGELFGMPKGTCVRFPASMLHHVDVNDLNEFYFPSPDSLTPQDLWKDPKKAAAYMSDLLEQVNRKFHNPEFDREVGELRKSQDFTPYLTKVYAQTVLDTAHTLYETYPKETELVDKLVDAGHNIDYLSSAMSEQRKFQPRIPLKPRTGP